MQRGFIANANTKGAGGVFWYGEFHANPVRRGQTAEDRGQKKQAAFRAPELTWIADHCAKNAPNFRTHCGKAAMILGGDVTAVAGEVERTVGLIRLAVAVRQLADKVRFVSALRPSLAQVEADRP